VAVAARTPPILDHERLPQTFSEGLSDNTRQRIRRAARRVAHDKPHRPCGIFLGQRDAWQHRQGARACSQTQKFTACFPHVSSVGTGSEDECLRATATSVVHFRS
jgi:hypothetical protein